MTDTSLSAAKFQEAWALHQRGQIKEAWDLYQQVLELQPRHFDALQLMGLIAAQANLFELAVKLLTDALAIQPTNATVHFNRAKVFADSQQFEAALDGYDQAIRFGLADAGVWNNRGKALRRLQRYEDAVASHDRALALQPDDVDAYHGRGLALEALGHLSEALANYDRVLSLRSAHLGALYARGVVLTALRHLEAARASFDKAVALKPDFAEAYINRGAVLADLKRHDAALADFAQAIALKPDSSEAHNNQGTTFKDLKRFDEAFASYERALALDPNSAEAYYNRGMAFSELKHREQAIADFDKALALKPDYPYLAGVRLHTKSHICDWRNFAAERTQVLEGVARGEKTALPFPVLTLIDSPALQRTAAATWGNDKHPANTALGPCVHIVPSGKIRVGYFSMDFRDHAVAQLMIGLLEAHNHDKFEICAFSQGPVADDPLRKRLEATFDTFFNVADKSDKDVAALARAQWIDIAVDLGGYTNEPRTGIFALRAAPVQVNFLGYPGTMGVDYIDYIIADRIVVPDEARGMYTEKVVVLPNSYQPNEIRKVAGRDFTRAEHGLPPTGIVFCCFNNSCKLNPEAFDSWIRILTRVPGSVLWLLVDNPSAESNLRAEAERRGFADRVIYAPRAPYAEYIARYRAADLFLDTLPYNAHTTASDALSSGLPVVTCMGLGFASRVAASLLSAVGLPEMITAAQDAYEDLAVALATDPARLARVRAKLLANLSNTPLFDSALYARHIETAYAQMIDRLARGLPPDDIVVAP